MALDYAPLNPRDESREILQNYPMPLVAKVTTAGAPPAASSVVSFGANTTVVEITALNASLAIKWGAASVISTSGATANYDHIVPVNTTRRFVIPRSVIGVTASIVGKNVLNGLYNSMAVITVGSVATGITEY